MFAPERQHDLRRPVPPRGHVLCEMPHWLIWRRVVSPAQAEITYLQFTVRVDEQVAWLQIAVNNSSRVHVLHACLLKSIVSDHPRQGNKLPRRI